MSIILKYVMCCFTAIILMAGCVSQKTNLSAGNNIGQADLEGGILVGFGNSDVRWTFEHAVLSPQLSDKAENVLLQIRETCPHERYQHELILLLDDPERYQLAHVFLTFLTGKPYTATADSWNNFSWKRGQGVAVNRGGELSRLKSFWMASFSATSE